MFDREEEEVKAIWKFTLKNHESNLEIPAGYEVLSVVEQHDNITLYCIVNPENELVDAQFIVIGTGWDISDKATVDMKFIGTVLTSNGALVWHVFQNVQVK